jgi:hypothetical protein
VDAGAGPVRTRGEGSCQRIRKTCSPTGSGASSSRPRPPWNWAGAWNRLTDDGTFTSADIGRQVRVGYLGTRKYTLELAHEDTPHRPWFTWIGVLIGLTAVVPGILAIMILHAWVRHALRFRRRSAG